MEVWRMLCDSDLGVDSLGHVSPPIRLFYVSKVFVLLLPIDPCLSFHYSGFQDSQLSEHATSQRSLVQVGRLELLIAM